MMIPAIMQVRSAHPGISMGGQDYYNQLAPYLVNLSYTDNCDGKKADDLSFELADRDGQFITTWMPEKGAYLDVTIIAERWFMPYAPGISLDCGRFWIDSIEFELPARRVKVKGTSIPTNIRLKTAKEHRGWDKTSLRDIANQIAGENQMSLDWEADNNPRYGRTEMHDESSLAFLMSRCLDAKLEIKIHRTKIVIFDPQKLEEAAPAFTLLYGNMAAGPLGSLLGGLGVESGAPGGQFYRMSGGHFTTRVTDTTNKAKVSAMDLGTGELNSGEYTASDQDVEDNTDDKVNHDTDNEEGEGNGSGNGGSGGGGTRELAGTDWGEGASAGSSLKAKSHVRGKNKDKNHASIELSLGNPLIAAGQTFTLQGVGQFDGKWFIESAHHTVGPEYNTKLECRKCLQGY